MNWGYKILIVYATFVVGILFLVIRSSSQKMDLVTSDYYGKELKFQQKIDEVKRVAALLGPVNFEISADHLTILFPKDFSGKIVNGEIVLYRPSDEGQDITKKFSVQDAPVIMPFVSMNKGLYELHLSWESEGVSYYFEKKIII